MSRFERWVKDETCHKYDGLMAPLPDPVVFVGGSERSGTTLLRNMLSAHPGLAIPDESPFVYRTYRLLASRGQLDDLDLAWRLIRDSDRFGQWELPSAEVQRLLSDHPPTCYADLVRALFGAYARSQGKQHSADKTTGNALRFPWLAAHFPGSRFVHLLRDPREVCMSRAVQIFSTFGLPGAARHWRAHVAAAQAASVVLGDRMLEVRYEALVSEPREQLVRLCAFIGIPFDESMLRHSESSDVIPRHDPGIHSGQPVQDGLRRWREELSVDDVSVIEFIASGLMEEVGYPRELGRLTPRAAAAIAREMGRYGHREWLYRGAPRVGRLLRARGCRSMMTTHLPPSREESGSGKVAAGLSVVISVHNDAGHLERCLRSLAPERSELNEVIVVDDESSDTSTALARAAGCEVIRLPRRRGLAAARNVGASRAAGEILVFIDADTTVRPGWAGALRAAFADGASLSGGGITWPEPHSLAERLRTGGYWHDETARNGFLPFVSGAHFAIRREVFIALGSFDESPLSEDLDLSFRAQLAGYDVSFVPRAELVHWPRRSVRGLLRQRIRIGRSRRFADYKYRLFPFAPSNRGRYSAIGAFAASAKRMLIAGTSADVGDLSLPALRAVVTMAGRLGVLRAEFELMLGLVALPEPVRGRDHGQQNTSAPLPGRPALLLVGDDRLVMKALKVGLTGSRRLKLGPPGLEREALERWDDPAPWSLRLARKAVREGWRLALETTALRIEREHPRTWGDAFLTLHRVNAWAHERPCLALAAFGDPGWQLANKLPDVPIVVAGSHDGCPSDRIVLQVSRADLLRQRRDLFKTLALVRDQAIERSINRVAT